MARALAALILVLASFQAIPQTAMTGASSLTAQQAENISIVQWEVWNLACQLKKIQKCEQLPMPKVAYGLLPGNYGLYRINSDIVLVDIRLIGQEFGALVMLHEMIHYIQDLERPLSGGLISAEQSCADEAEAFTLAFQAHLKYHLAAGDFRVKTWSEAREAYKHCNPPTHPIHRLGPR